MPDPSSSLSTVVSPDDAVEPRQRFSEVLSDLASRPTATISIGDVLDAFGDRAFGALMLLFAAPNVLPLPPGMSAVLGAPLLFVTAQLMLGRPVLWMPRFIRERSISRDFFTLLTSKLSPILHRMERFLRPRLGLLLSPVPERIVGAACLLLALILFLPIPFGNMPPAFAISAFALGIVERDGIATLVGWLAALGSLLILAAISSAIVAGINAFLDQLWVTL
ncbi:exopolysaccharide biosynthesis protein [Microvirga lotononidis]|uniref:Putative ABC-type transport system, permease component n=1 Tax=Microvirga lotononidis TaxID=864069 RepID=I4YPR8_9HYPH|nr:exopolysaccharide biosynthesis protein [Microvirga lotononidis]EIM25960.1 putative ABC-type transport system, permease component [Microvirga lotononidis]WQO25873.1 exopolysaccharide biosynthesis protein [Microvirga lotononidis]